MYPYPFNFKYVHINVMDSTQKEKMTQVADPHNAPDMSPIRQPSPFHARPERPPNLADETKNEKKERREI